MEHEYLEGAYKVLRVEDAHTDAGWWITLASTGEMLRGPFVTAADAIETARRYERLTAGLT